MHFLGSCFTFFLLLTALVCLSTTDSASSRWSTSRNRAHDMTDGKNRKSSHSDLRPLNRKQRQSFAGTRGKARSDAKTANHKCNRMNEAFSRQRRRPLLIPVRGLARSACQSFQRSRYPCAMMLHDRCRSIQSSRASSAPALPMPRRPALLRH